MTPDRRPLLRAKFDAAMAWVWTMLISAVPSDAPQDIASGRTVADPTTCAEALAIIERYKLDAPPAVRALLASAEGVAQKHGDPRLARNKVRMITASQRTLEATARVASAVGITPHNLGDSLEGEARDLDKTLAGIARQVALVGLHALAGDADGVDGLEEIAGANTAPDTLPRSRALGISPRLRLDINDSHGYFGALGDAVVTGPTLTNVNHFRAIVIDGPRAA